MAFVFYKVTTDDKKKSQDKWFLRCRKQMVAKFVTYHAADT